MKRDMAKSGYWQSDDEALNCNSCGRQFCWSRRRHHCRYCGYIFCSDCLTEQYASVGYKYICLKACHTIITAPEISMQSITNTQAVGLPRHTVDVLLHEFDEEYKKMFDDYTKGFSRILTKEYKTRLPYDFSIRYYPRFGDPVLQRESDLRQFCQTTQITLEFGYQQKIDAPWINCENSGGICFPLTTYWLKHIIAGKSDIAFYQYLIGQASNLDHPYYTVTSIADSATALYKFRAEIFDVVRGTFESSSDLVNYQRYCRHMLHYRSARPLQNQITQRSGNYYEPAELPEVRLALINIIRSTILQGLVPSAQLNIQASAYIPINQPVIEVQYHAEIAQITAKLIEQFSVNFSVTSCYFFSLSSNINISSDNAHAIGLAVDTVEMKFLLFDPNYGIFSIPIDYPGWAPVDTLGYLIQTFLSYFHEERVGRFFLMLIKP